MTSTSTSIGLILVQTLRFYIGNTHYSSSNQILKPKFLNLTLTIASEKEGIKMISVSADTPSCTIGIGHDQMISAGITEPRSD